MNSLSKTSCNRSEQLADEVPFAIATNRGGSRSSVYQDFASPSMFLATRPLAEQFQSSFVRRTNRRNPRPKTGAFAPLTEQPFYSSCSFSRPRPWPLGGGSATARYFLATENQRATARKRLKVLAMRSA